MGGAGRELAGLLARRLREAGQEAGQTVSVAELHRVLIPYHECRDRLGYATKAEYDVALLRLLRDGEVLSVEEDRLTKAVERELDSPEPGLAFLRNFAAAQLSIRAAGETEAADAAARAFEAGARQGEGEAAARGDGPPEARGGASVTSEARGGTSGEGDGTSGEGDGTAGAGDGTAGAGARPTERPEGAPETGLDWLATLEPAERTAPSPPAAGPCWRCGEALPRRDGLRYCPFCGTDQTDRRCLSCGEELDRAWDFCPRCGTEVRTPGSGAAERGDG